MIVEYNRRVKKVFKRLAEVVGTRDQSQCKSHHQKMLRTYGNIEKIIEVFSKNKPNLLTPVT